MSTLAYVFCVLLVATATTATDDVFDTKKTMETIDAAINVVMDRYASARNTMNDSLSHMKLEKPLDTYNWADHREPLAAECLTFLSKYTETHRSQMIGCSWPNIQELSLELGRLENSLTSVLERFDELKRSAERCAAWAALFVDSAYHSATSKAAECKDEVHQEIVAINTEDSEAIKNFINSTKDMTKKWGEDVAYCLYVEVDDISEEDLRKACPLASTPDPLLETGAL